MQRIAPYLVGLLVLSAATGCTKKKDNSSTSSSSSSSTTTSTTTGTSTSSTSTSTTSSTGGTTGTSTSSSSSSSSGSTGSGSSGSTGSSGSSGSSGSTGLTRAQFCTQAEPLLCAVAASCQATDPATANCEALVANVASNLLGCSAQTASDEALGLLQFDPTATSGCLAALHATADCSTTGQTALITACSVSRLFKPGVPVGGACAESSDCVPDVLADGGVAGSSCYVDQLSASCTQTCRSNARQLGEDCEPYTSGVFCVAGACNPDPNGGPVFLQLVGTSGYVCSLYTATGASCDYYNVCDPAHDYCQQSFDADAGLTVGTCAPRDAAAVCGTGDCYSTSGNNCSCPLGTVCAPSLGVQSQGTCQAPAALGAACDNSIISQPCQAGLVCVPTNGGTGASTCVHQTAALGEACNPGYGSNCAEGTYCSSAVQPTCIAEAAVGQPCDLSAGNCPPGLQCQGPADGGTATCSTLGLIGADCSSSNCRALLGCVGEADGGSVCAPRLVVGDACDPAANGCYGSYCDPGTLHCAAYLPAGSVCDPQAYGACGRQYCVGVADGGAVCTTECFFPTR